MLTNVAFFAWWAGAIGMALALALYLWIRRQPQGNDVMRGIAEQIHSGAMAFLRRGLVVSPSSWWGRCSSRRRRGKGSVRRRRSCSSLPARGMKP